MPQTNPVTKSSPRTGQKEPTRKASKRKRKPVTIAVMGPTGSGKTSFINLASGSALRVGHGLQSATDSIQFSQPFTVDEYEITLVDTPGFDDTTKSDADVLAIIANYLNTPATRLNGIIYLHRITDNRMGGTALRNFKMFFALCGKKALSNAAIVLNMWNEVNKDIGEDRERELLSKEMFFKPAIDAGAKPFRHDNSIESARVILRLLAKHQPKTLLIQQELLSQRKPIRQTSAGIALLAHLAERERRHVEQLEEVKKDIEEAITQKNAEDRRELEETRRGLEEMRKKVQRQQERIQSSTRTTAPPSWQCMPFRIPVRGGRQSRT